MKKWFTIAASGCICCTGKEFIVKEGLGKEVAE